MTLTNNYSTVSSSTRQQQQQNQLLTSPLEDISFLTIRLFFYFLLNRQPNRKLIVHSWCGDKKSVSLQMNKHTMLLNCSSFICLVV